VRHRLGVALSMSCIAVVVGCGSDGSSAPGGGSDTSGAVSTSKATTKAAPAPAATDPRATLTSVSADKVGKIEYSRATSKVRSRLAVISDAAKGVAVGTRLSTVSLQGRAVGGVASVAVPSKMAGNAMFQDQFVVQLLNAVSKGSEKPRFVRLSGRPVAVTQGKLRLAGWFEGSRAVVLAIDSAEPDVTSLAAAVMEQHPPHA